MTPVPSSLFATLSVSLFFFVFQMVSVHSLSTTPMNCTDTSRLCTSFLAFKPTQNQTLALIQSMYDVLPKDLTVEATDPNYVFVKKNCSCESYTKKYFTNTTFTVRANDGFISDLVAEAYGGLAVVPGYRRRARVGAVVTVRLYCGCSIGLWNYLMSYVMRDGDSVESLASRFGVSMGSIEAVNGIDNPDNVTVGALYYIPLNSVPGEPYPLENAVPPAPVPATSNSNFSVVQANHKDHVPYGWIIGGLGVGLALIAVLLVICVCLKSSSCFAKGRGSLAKDSDGKNPHKFQILRTRSYCCGSGRYSCCKSADVKQTNGESSNLQMNIPKAIGTDVFDMEKPVVFTYEEILSSTDGFSDSNLLGHGTYGSVYYGVLHDQVELIGYAASDDELFLIYEYAQKGSLKSHLHDPQNKGQKVVIPNCSHLMNQNCLKQGKGPQICQIALDAARGIEYIHEHTKTHYVHRDIKTSNILLDGAFRAKISDFGLAKLVGKTGEGEASATRVVGTFGYLAPEYLSDGLATTKSDVYAFGIVLFEIISGKEAVTRTEGMVMKNPERRSLASIG
ncbi:LysM domain receptor-like kinase 3 [Vitis vinifera]|uniref:LysM domain receptor-like kinase 3 n=1 Tax=Vitis vinifera TaxID=29760 RepID=A0A438GX76_VITVI|nr:LysM domain receptor-like kinase 3 [Vitis vinifera]